MNEPEADVYLDVDVSVPFSFPISVVADVVESARQAAMLDDGASVRHAVAVQRPGENIVSTLPMPPSWQHTTTGSIEPVGSVWIEVEVERAAPLLTAAETALAIARRARDLVANVVPPGTRIVVVPMNAPIAPTRRGGIRG